MRRITGIGLILTAVGMIFGSLAFGDQAEKMVRPLASSPVPGIYRTPENGYALNLPLTIDARKEDLSQFENDSQAKARFGYQSGKIPLTGNSFDPPAKFVSTLAVGRYKEENALSLTLDKFKEDDILRSLAIFLELKLNF